MNLKQTMKLERHQGEPESKWRYKDILINHINGRYMKREKLDLKTFFNGEGIDVFAEVSVSDLPDTDRAHVMDTFPAARSIIVFGKEVPVQAYRSPPKEKTRVMLGIAEVLDQSAGRLAERLNNEQIPTLAVPLYLPVRMLDGRVQGVVRLKHVAAAGKLGAIGKNSLLLSPRYGPRLLLSGVVTSLPATEDKPDNTAGTGTGPADAGLCTGCGRCVRVCPEGAFGPDGIDLFRCRTVSTWISPPLVPVVKWLLGRQMLLKGAAPLAPWIARVATIRCSLCVTECPRFTGAQDK